MQQKSENVLKPQKNGTAQEQDLEAKNDSFPKEAKSWILGITWPNAQSVWNGFTKHILKK